MLVLRSIRAWGDLQWLATSAKRGYGLSKLGSLHVPAYLWCTL